MALSTLFGVEACNTRKKPCGSALRCTRAPPKPRHRQKQTSLLRLSCTRYTHPQRAVHLLDEREAEYPQQCHTTNEYASYLRHDLTIRQEAQTPTPTNPQHTTHNTPVPSLSLPLKLIAKAK